MLGRAVWFCHEKFVFYRYIQPNDLVIAADVEVKLANLGLARPFSIASIKNCGGQEVLINGGVACQEEEIIDTVVL